MANRVHLSEDALEALDHERRERVLSPEEHLEMIERMDAADRETARRQWAARHGDDA